jgi:hypothetical protein
VCFLQLSMAFWKAPKTKRTKNDWRVECSWTVTKREPHPSPKGSKQSVPVTNQEKSVYISWISEYPLVHLLISLCWWSFTFFFDSLSLVTLKDGTTDGNT